MKIHNYNVLLAEDNPVNQYVGRTMMEAFGCRVDVASNGSEVLDRMESTRYDIVFMDCEMPVMDGLEATRLIRQREKQQRKPMAAIVALTAHGADEDRSRCLEAGMDDYLGKPFRMLDLSRLMEKWHVRISVRDSVASCQGFQSDSGPPENVTENYLDRNSLDNIRSLGPNGPRMLSTVISIYLNDSPILLDRLSEIFDAVDVEGMARVAHSLKSTSARLGATALATMCRQLEDIARGNSIDGAGTLISQIRLEYGKVKEALMREIQKGF
ncbi:MAG TPA: response regulator [Deltaproteobacteria bacterium]|jgi:CheY-like chemotaxis protein|nr:response regulator [Deltaproteobacteria bacterium]